VNPEDAEEYTAALGQVVAGGYRQVALGKRLGVPEALGLTVGQWVEGRLGGYVRLAIPERQSAVLELDNEGWTNREIAEVLGVSKSTVNDDLAVQNRTDGNDEQDASRESVQNRTDDSPVHVTINTGEIEWYTPGNVIEAARNVLGGIDLDPASTALANATVGAARYFTVDDDGLARPWKGRVWLNPPYRTGLVERFIYRAIDLFEQGDVTAAVVLTNNATDTRWWQRLAAAASAVCFPAGRIRFLAHDGEQRTPLQGQTIAYLGGDGKVFVEEFARFGEVR
jgi:DNA N-6-adenine-methyltransferase (Dam)/Sigma-70, region 4